MTRREERLRFEEALGPTLTRLFGCGWNVGGFEPDSYDDPGVEHYWEGWLAAKQDCINLVSPKDMTMEVCVLAISGGGGWHVCSLQDRIWKGIDTNTFHRKARAVAWANANGYKVVE